MIRMVLSIKPQQFVEFPESTDNIADVLGKGVARELPIALHAAYSLASALERVTLIVQVLSMLSERWRSRSN